MALHVSALLDEMCEEAKQEMKDMDPSEIGSWERAVTMGDAAWLTRGFHSQNCTFTVRNNITNSLLYYEHLCQRGEDEYKGTSKAAEGFGAERVFKRAKEEGLEIEVHWQDKDSSSSKALKSNFPTAQLVYRAFIDTQYTSFSTLYIKRMKIIIKVVVEYFPPSIFWSAVSWSLPK